MFARSKSAHRSPLSLRNTDGLKALTANYLLMQFAVGMVGAFGIIFLYQFGSGLLDGLVYVTAYLLLNRLLIAILIAPAGYAISRVGYRWMMLTGVVALAIKLYLLSQSSVDNLAPLALSLVFSAISITAYYLSYHALFLDDNDDEKIGEQIGKLEMIGRLATVISPFIGGLIIEYFGFTMMFLVAMVLMIISAVPLLIMKSHSRHKGVYSVKAVWEFLNNRPVIMGAFYSWSFTAAMQAVHWAILLFIVIGSYALYGLIGSVTMLVGAVSMYFVGKIYDKRHAKKMFLTSSAVVSITWVGRFLSTSLIGYILSDVINRLFSPMWWMKIRRQELVAGEKVDSLVFGAAHEYMVTFGYLTALLVCFVLLVLSDGNWGLLAIPAVGATILATWLVRDK